MPETFHFQNVVTRERWWKRVLKRLGLMKESGIGFYIGDPTIRMTFRNCTVTGLSMAALPGEPLTEKQAVQLRDFLVPDSPEAAQQNTETLKKLLN